MINPAGTNRLRCGTSIILLSALLASCSSSGTAARAAGSSGQATGQRSQPQQGDQVVVRDGLGQMIDAHLSRYADYGYSFSILVADGDTVLLQKAYGPGVDPSTVYNAASVGKQFTATAIVKLASQGKLKLSDSISRFFPDAPESVGRVTVDQLLSHTSAIQDDYVTGAFETPERLLQHIYSRGLVREPGVKWEYSNYSYSLLAAIVAKASGQPFKTYMRQQLFAPAGLRNTGFETDTAWPASQRPKPRGGMKLMDWPEQGEGDWWGFGLGSGDIVTSPADLFRWVQALRQGKVLPEAWRKKLDEPIIAYGRNFYGRGWWNRRFEAAGEPRLNIWHSGQMETGFSAWLNRYPADDLTVIFNTNQGVNGQPLRAAFNSPGDASLLERLIFGGEVYVPPRVVEHGDLQRFSGRYWLDTNSWIDVTAKPPFLDVVPHGQRAFDLLLPSGSGDTATAASQEATQRATEIFTELRDGKTDAFRRYWNGDTKEPPKPKFDNFRILGSAPMQKVTAASSSVVTYLLLFRGGKEELWRLQWSGGKISFIFTSDTPVVPLFRAIDKDSFANLQPFIKGSSFLHFSNDGVTLGGVQARRR